MARGRLGHLREPRGVTLTDVGRGQAAALVGVAGTVEALGERIALHGTVALVEPWDEGARSLSAPGRERLTAGPGWS